MEENRISHCIIGLGVNLTQKEFPEDLSAIATSVTLENGSVGKAELLVGILRELSDLYPSFLSNRPDFLPNTAIFATRSAAGCRFTPTKSARESRRM